MLGKINYIVFIFNGICLGFLVYGLVNVGQLERQVQASDPISRARITYEKTKTIENLLAYSRSLDSSATASVTLRDSVKGTFLKELAKVAGTKHKVKWNLLYAVWINESNLNPLAISCTNARGLGQVSLHTARLMYDTSMTKERLFNPIENGMASAKILAQYIDSLKSTMWGISAYHQGPYAAMNQKKAKTIPKDVSYVLGVMQSSLEVE
jgi:soluble lytic murein transglycosylase-like protein